MGLVFWNQQWEGFEPKVGFAVKKTCRRHVFRRKVRSSYAARTHAFAKQKRYPSFSVINRQALFDACRFLLFHSSLFIIHFNHLVADLRRVAFDLRTQQLADGHLQHFGKTDQGIGVWDGTPLLHFETVCLTT